MKPLSHPLRPRLPALFALALLLAPAARAHLCDNVFRQADKLIVKPEVYNLIVKDAITVKIFLQNNMDRGIAEISLVGNSPAFEFAITPQKMSIPKNQRAYFEVTLTPKAGTKSGNYPVNFRLVGGGRLFKTFSLNTGSEAAAPAPAAGAPAGPDPAGAKPPAGVPAAVPAAADVKRLTVRPSPAAPQVDGKLDDRAWKNAAVLANFSAAGGGEAVYDTTGLLLYDASALYLSLFCNDEDTAALTDRDTVEILLSRDPAGKPAWRLAVSPAGRVQWKRILADGKETAWPASGIQVSTDKQDRTWSLELAIPLDALQARPPAAPERWFLRITRTKAAGNAETSFWAADASGYNQDKGLGEFLLTPAAPAGPGK